MDQPSAVPMTMPSTSPIAQPVRQCTVALRAQAVERLAGVVTGVRVGGHALSPGA